MWILWILSDSNLHIDPNPNPNPDPLKPNTLFIRFKVIVFAEEDLIRGARIRASLGISHGQDEESALFYRDKIKMKNKLKAAGVAVPVCAPVESASDVVNFTAKYGYDVCDRVHSQIMLTRWTMD